MDTVTTVKSFVRQFTAFVKGDDTKALAEKAFRQASSALKAQISSLEGDTIDKEDALTRAIEEQAEIRINKGNPIVDRTKYAESLLEAKNAVTAAQEALDLHKEKIEFFKSELVILETEVPE